MARRHGWVCWIGAAALALACAACGKETNPPPAEPTTTATPANGVSTPAASSAAKLTIADLDKVTKAGKPYRIELIVKTRNNPFFTPMISAFETEAASLGAKFHTDAPQRETDKEQQFDYVKNVTAQGVDAILIAPADSRAIIPALKAAQDKQILVVNLDNRVDGTEAASQGVVLGGYVGADNEAGGKLAGDAMVKALGGKGKVAIIEGIRGADNAEARKRGFEAGVQGKLEIVDRETANWDLDQANAKCATILQAHPDLDGVFCANDMMALGAIKAVQQAGKRGKVKVIGYDNIPAVQEKLKSGELTATIEQHPDLMGKYGVKMAIGILDGAVPKGREFLVPLEVITR